MGMQTTRPGGMVRRSDAAVAKNHLTKPELQVLHRIVNLYIEFAELQALERNPMTMHDWVRKLDEFLIGGMKLAAICQRSVKRDYVDPHAILTMGGVSMGALVSAWNHKFPGKEEGFALRALAYFADVEKARMPEMLSKTTWERVKTDLQNLVARHCGT